MNIRVFRLALLLSGLPFLSGCLTYETIDAAKNPGAESVYDDYAHAEKAAIWKDNQLLIFLKGSITNSSKDSRFTLAVPLAEIETKAGAYQGSLWRAIGTNESFAARLYLERDSLHEGWPEENSNEVEIVPVGPPISPQNAWPNSFMGKLPKTANLLTNSTRALYQVRQEGHFEFIYIDSSYRREYTDIGVISREVSRRIEPGYFILLPITVPLDIATAPLQIPFYIYVMYSFGHSGC